jgi:hypothetical protein
MAEQVRRALEPWFDDQKLRRTAHQAPRGGGYQRGDPARHLRGEPLMAPAHMTVFSTAIDETTFRADRGTGCYNARMQAGSTLVTVSERAHDS